MASADHHFKQTMSPLAVAASRILAKLRNGELATVWNSDFEESLSEKNDGNLYPGMMFSLARDRMERTVLWRIIERMPKGALLHAHMDACVDVDWLIEETLSEPGIHILSAQNLHDDKLRDSALIQFEYHESSYEEVASIWTSHYIPSTPIPIQQAAMDFPGGETAFRAWLMNRCLITPEESLNHHHGLNAIWRKFQSTFLSISGMLFYEPLFRKAVQRLLQQLAADRITWVEFRIAFRFSFRLAKRTEGEEGYLDFFRVFDEEVEKFKDNDAGANFRGARMIWTVIRSMDDRTIAASMRECITAKRAFPHLISGFDFVGQEDKGRTLADLTPLIFWFRKQCMEAGVEIPFFFHAGECLGDGDSTDNNLFDAVLLGTRRIGHGFSLYKHPLLIDMVKDKKILVETCPISNEVLRLTSSILSHTMPALLSRGVPVSLNNDDPAILGHGKNGLSHDFWQSFMAYENLGLEGLATMAENSLRWSAFADQSNQEWLRDMANGYVGSGVKAEMMNVWRSEFERFCQWIIMEFPEDDD